MWGYVGEMGYVREVGFVWSKMRGEVGYIGEAGELFSVGCINQNVGDGVDSHKRA